MRRKVPFVTGEFYHIYNTSIDGLKVFNNDLEFFRMKAMMRYYLSNQPTMNFAHFLRVAGNDPQCAFVEAGLQVSMKKKRVRLVAYCLMSTHWHMIVEQIEDQGISNYIRCIDDSYSNYFNIKYKRKGPLWVGRFGSKRIEKTTQLLQEASYIHLNPVTAYLVKKPEEWTYSSYLEYLGNTKGEECLCSWQDVFPCEPQEYQVFVEEQIEKQRELAKIKKLLASEF